VTNVIKIAMRKCFFIEFLVPDASM
jgi:hypothetical protein